jgi:hypothetical protein
LRPSRTTRRPTSATAVGREPEVLEDRARRRRRAEMVEPDDRALVADPALPAERDADSTLTRLRTSGGRTDRDTPGPARRSAPSRAVTRPAWGCRRARASGRGDGQLELGPGRHDDQLRRPDEASRST